MAAEDRHVWANLGNMAMNLGDDTAHRSAFTTTLAAARTDGSVMDVLYALHRLFLSEYAAGDWTAMRRSFEEAVSLARSIGQPAQTGTPLACLALLAALPGRDDYDELLAGATEVLTGHRLGVMDQFVPTCCGGHKPPAGHAGDTAQSLHHFARMHEGAPRRREGQLHDQVTGRPAARRRRFKLSRDVTRLHSPF